MSHLVIDKDIHKWLVNEGILNSKIKYAEVGARQYELDDATTKKFDNGHAIQKILEKCFESKLQDFFINNSLILKNSHVPASRAYNWRLIGNALEKLNLSIDKEIINQIISGDILLIHEILRDLFKLSSEESKIFSKFIPDPKELLSESFVSIDPTEINALFQPINIRHSMLRSQSIMSGDINATRQSIKLNQGSLAKLRFKRDKLIKVLAKSQVDALDLKKVDSTKDLKSVSQGLELIIVSISKNFGLNSIQASSFISNRMKVFGHIIIKGMQKNFEPVINFFTEMIDNVKRISDLCHVDQTDKNLHSMLQIFKSGIVSKDFNVAQLATIFLNKLGRELTDRGDSGKLWNWVTSSIGMTNLWVLAVYRYQDNVSELLRLILVYVDNNIEEFFLKNLSEYFMDRKEYFKFLHILGPQIHLHPKLKHLFDSPKFLKEIFDVAYNGSEIQASARGNCDNQLFCLKILLDYLQYFPKIYTDDEEKIKKLIKIIKSNFIAKNTLFKIQLTAILFGILECLIKMEKHSFVSSIYVLISSLLNEYHSNSSFRLYMINELLHHFKKNSIENSLVLYEPFIKTITSLEGMSFLTNLHDLNLLQILCQNEIDKNIKKAMPILDILIKIYLKNVNFSAYIFEFLTSIISKFKINQAFINFLGKIVKESLLAYYASERKKGPRSRVDVLAKIKTLDNIDPNLSEETSKKHNKVLKSIKKETKKKNKDEISRKELENEKILSHRRSLIIELIKFIINQRVKSLKTFIRDYVLYINLLLKKLQLEDPTVLKPSNNKGMMALLKIYGDPREIIIRHEQEAEFKILQGFSLDYGDDAEPVGRTVITNSLESFREILTKEKIYEMARRKGVKTDPKVAQNIKEIREEYLKGVQEKEQEQIITEKKRLQQMEYLKKKIEIRNIELGVPTRSDDILKAIIQPFDSIGDIEDEKRKALNGLVYRVFDATCEEDSVEVALEIILENFKPAVKQVFESLSKQNIKNFSNNFEQMIKDGQLIHRKQILQFVIDHNLQSFISKEHLYMLVRDVKVKVMKDQIEVMTLNYDGFVQLMLNLACFIFSQPKFGMGHLPPSYLLFKFIEHLKKVWATNGYSTLIFTEPEAINYIDPEVILYLNKQLLKNKNYPIPKMLEIYTERRIDFVYSLPAELKIPSKKKFCYDVLDDLVYKLFDFHILPLRHKIKSFTKVRPKKFDHLTAWEKKKKEFETMDDLDSEVLAEENQKKIEAQYNKALVLQRQQIVDHEVIVKELPMNFRVELANFNLDDRGSAIECALSIHTLFNAVADRKKVAPVLANIRFVSVIKNKLMAKNELKAKMLKQSQRKQNEKFLSYSRLLIDRSEELKESHKKRLEQQKLDEKKKENEEIQYERQRLVKLKAFWSDKVKSVKDLREQEKTERLKMIEQEEEDKKQQMTERAQNFKEFHTKELKKFQTDMKHIVQHRKEEIEKEKQKQINDAALIEKLKKKAMEDVEQGKILSAQTKEFEETIKTAFNNTHIHEIFDKYSSHLYIIYHFFLKQQHYTVGKPSNLNEMTFEGAYKFANQFGLVPYVLKLPAFERIYKLVIKKKPWIDQMEPGLTYEEFLYFLLKIIVKEQSFFAETYNNFQTLKQKGYTMNDESNQDKAEADEEAEEEQNNDENQEDEKNDDNNEEAEDENKESDSKLVSNEGLEGFFLLLRIPETRHELEKKLVSEKKDNAKLLPNRMKKMILKYSNSK